MAMTTQSTEVAPLAYRKIVYHSAKYMSSTVIGILVGTTRERVEDVIPFVHHWHTLSPMTEAGMALVEAHTAKHHQQILGLYEVPEHLAQKDVSPTTAALAETLATRMGHAPLLFNVRISSLTPAQWHKIDGYPRRHRCHGSGTHCAGPSPPTRVARFGPEAGIRTGCFSVPL